MKFCYFENDMEIFTETFIDKFYRHLGKIPDSEQIRSHSKL